MLETAHLVFGIIGAVAAGLVTWVGLPIQIWRIHKNPLALRDIEKSIIYLATTSYTAFALYGLTNEEILWPLVLGYSPGFFFGSYLIYQIRKYRKHWKK